MTALPRAVDHVDRAERADQVDPGRAAHAGHLGAVRPHDHVLSWSDSLIATVNSTHASGREPGLRLHIPT